MDGADVVEEEHVVAEDLVVEGESIVVVVGHPSEVDTPPATLPLKAINIITSPWSSTSV